MKLSIITPCYNAVRYLDETVQSVLNQNAVKSGRVELEYWIVDGASSDGTMNLLSRYKDAQINILSENDNGMYDALTKGLKRVSGDLVAYINAGDYYHPSAFDVIADIMCDSSVKWLTATNFFYNEKSQVVDWFQPRRYKKNFIAQGVYGTIFPHIQQESTFWRRELLEYVDLEVLSKQRYAGDFLLWKQFCAHAELDIVKAQIAGFKVHDGQLSEALNMYTLEMKEISPTMLSWRIRIAAKIESLLQAMPGPFRRMVGAERIYQYNYVTKSWAIHS